MQLWRIATEKWALDKTGNGARLHGGRWNPVGWPAVYAGSTIEICALEKYVHLSNIPHPKLFLVSIKTPDDPALYYRPDLKDLPIGWAELPIAACSQEFGKKWLAASKDLVMLIPSAIIYEAQNAVINPQHPEIENVQIQIVREFTFDPRMLHKSPILET